MVKALEFFWTLSLFWNLLEKCILLPLSLFLHIIFKAKIKMQVESLRSSTYLLKNVF